jgi:glycosyltransferase involved in cell wall biosynthesis
MSDSIDVRLPRPARADRAVPQTDRRVTRAPRAEPSDLVCLSHLRWDFVTQRPQHLLARCAKRWRVYFVEEPVLEDRAFPELEVGARGDNLWVARVRLPAGMGPEASLVAQRDAIDELLGGHRVRDYVLWYYTPMALPFTRHLKPRALVYDCMDELSAFAGAPPELIRREAELFTRADLVFTGGQSLYESKRSLHDNAHAFPSSVDVAHFARARRPLPDPEDQAEIPHPRLGWFGVIDERMDLDLVRGVAEARPDWHLVMLGPVVKIDPSVLPRLPNVHWLGGKPYGELPAYLAAWDVAILPFARNEATRYISPTKTPEYLAAGKPVVSTSIRDVVRPYGESGIVSVADDVEGWVRACEAALAAGDRSGWLDRVDRFLAGTSWDRTWERMERLLLEALERRRVLD